MELFSSIKKFSESSGLSEDNFQKQYVSGFHTVEYTLSTIVDKISNIDNLNEAEIKNIILRQHSMILNYDLFLKSDESRLHAQKLFTNKRFLVIFNQVIGLLQLTREEIICINKLAYDYYITKNKDAEISDLLFQISYQINNVLVIRLSGILGMNGARVLSMIANSSFKDEKNVHRVNTFLVKCNLELSIQDIVDIYCILFERFMYPFIYSMLEIKTDNMTEDQLKRFDMISIALLLILDSMVSEDIKKILYNYSYILKLINTTNVRFSLKSAKAYTRILKVIEEIELDVFEDLIVP